MDAARFAFSVLFMFRQGLDTVAIAKALSLPEHVVANALARAREDERAQMKRAA